MIAQTNEEKDTEESKILRFTAEFWNSTNYSNGEHTKPKDHAWLFYRLEISTWTYKEHTCAYSEHERNKTQALLR